MTQAPLTGVAAIAAATFVSSALLASLARVLFYARLRRRHRARWEAIGSPNPLFNYMLFPSMTGLRRLLAGEGLAELGDRCLTLLAHLSSLLSVVAAASFLVMATDAWVLKH